MVVVRNARICVDSIEDIVLRKGGIAQYGTPLLSRALRCLQQRLIVCRLEKLTTDFVGFRLVASLRIDVLNLIVV